MPDVHRPPPDDREALIKRQQEEIARLRDALRDVERDRDRLKRRNERLKDQLDAARRAGFRQAAPFAKPHRQGTGRPPGRRAGATYGCHGTRPVPRRIDETHDAALPVACPACGGDVPRTHVVSQYQEDLPVVRPVVREFRVHVGACVACGRRVQGRHPLQTSDALGAAVQIGPEAAALVVVLHKGLGLPLAHVVTLLRDRFGLRVTRGALVHVCARAAARAAPTYEALCAQVRGSPAVSPDETGWKVAGTLHWLWAFTTADTTVYAIRPGRGFREAATILGEEFAGVLTPQPSVLIHGKGRRERRLPLWKTTAAAVRAWVAVRGTARGRELFVSARREPLTRAGVEYILRKHVQAARHQCTSLAAKRVSPHVLRHTCALTVLQGDQRPAQGLAVARTRAAADDGDLHAGRFVREAGGPGGRHASNLALRPIQGHRQAPRVPDGDSVMRSDAPTP